MKTRKLIGFSKAVVLAAAVAFYGCGGGGSSSAPATTTTTVTTSAQASSVGATGASTATVSANMGQTLSTVASPGAPKFKSALAGKDPRFAKFNQALATAMKAPRNRVAEIRKAQSLNRAPLFEATYDCANPGTATTATTNIMYISITTATDMTITFTQCRMDTARFNGTITESFTTNTQTSTTSFTTTLGNSDGTVTSADFTTELFETAATTDTTAYATLTIDLTETGTENNTATPPSYSFTANGKMKYDEGSNSYTMSLTNVTFAYSEATTGTMTTTSNGTFGETWTEAGVSKSTSITFESFVTTETPATDYSYTLYTADGKVTVDNTGFCADGDGIWVIVTNTALKEMTATGEIVAGKMTINTTTIVEFQTDGSVIVTASGGTATTVTKAEFDTIESSCAIADLNPGSPSVSGIAGGFYHTVAMKSDGTVKTWGANGYGQLGNGSTTTSSAPVSVSGLTGVTAIASGREFTMALKSDGTVWTWGRNDDGQLGDGTTSTASPFGKTTPVQVSGLTGVTAIAAGSFHSLAIKSDGTVWAWGFNGFGQMGVGNVATTRYNTPVQVSGLTGVTAIAGGYYHSVAVKNDGTVYTWGGNVYGQGSPGSTYLPTLVSGLTGVTAIRCGASYNVALKSDGTVMAWGSNTSGQLGDGTIIDRPTPVQVSGLTGVTKIDTGAGDHAIALKSDGTAWLWGYNSNGQLGDGTTTNRTAPVQVSGLTGATAIAAGVSHSAALKNDGTVWAWGKNTDGQLGDGTTTQSTTPVQVSGL